MGISVNGVEGLVHPAVWPALANHLVHAEVARGSWIHTRSIIRHHAQIHVAAGPGLASRMGTKRIHCANLADVRHRIQTLRQRLALSGKAGRQIVQQQFHDEKLT